MWFQDGWCSIYFLAQAKTLKILKHEIITYGINLDESIQVSIIIVAKLPPLWEDYWKEFKQKIDVINLRYLLAYLSVEDNFKILDSEEEETKGK